MAADVTTARSVYWPAFANGGAVTSNLADSASSSWAKLSGALVGVAFQPAGRSRDTRASAAPFAPLVTETWISRLTGVNAEPLEAGITARAGMILAENAG